MPNTTRTVLPLKDIQDALENRIEMLRGIQSSIESALSDSGTEETKTFNKAQLERAAMKLGQLQGVLVALNEACCPNAMDCPHDFMTD